MSKFKGAVNTLIMYVFSVFVQKCRTILYVPMITNEIMLDD